MPTNTQEVIKNSRESDGKYEEFIRAVELIYVGLKRCSASLERERLHDLYERNKRPQRTLKDDYRVTAIGANFFEASGAFIVKLRESIEVEPVLTVECEFEAHLHGPEPIPKQFVERFVNSEFQLILVPYARQFVSSVTSSMNIPPLFIPLSTRSASIRKERAKQSHGQTRR